MIRFLHLLILMVRDLVVVAGGCWKWQGTLRRIGPKGPIFCGRLICRSLGTDCFVALSTIDPLGAAGGTSPTTLSELTLTVVIMTLVVRRARL